MRELPLTTEAMSRSSTLGKAAQAQFTDAFSYNEGDAQANTPLDLGAGNDAPPAYGTLFDQLHLSQAGFNAGAVVTGMILPNADGLELPG